MTKRIAYLTSPRPVEGREVPSRPLLDEFEVDVVHSRAATFPGDGVDLLFMNVCTLEAGMRAQAEGYDAVLIGSVADYGIESLRSALRVPVVGCGQASLLVASAVGRRFSIVTIWPPSTAGHYRSILAANEFDSRCASVRYVAADVEMATLDEEENFYTEMRAGREHMVARILAEMQAAIDEDGADAVVLGCNCMTPVAPMLAERVDVPVIDPTSTGYALSVMLLSLGLAQSSRAFPPARSNRGRLFAEMIAAAADGLADEELTAADCGVSDCKVWVGGSMVS
jgi:allantoin racemase